MAKSRKTVVKKQDSQITWEFVPQTEWQDADSPDAGTEAEYLPAQYAAEANPTTGEFDVLCPAIPGKWDRIEGTRRNKQTSEKTYLYTIALCLDIDKIPNAERLRAITRIIQETETGKNRTSQENADVASVIGTYALRMFDVDSNNTLRSDLVRDVNEAALLSKLQKMVAKAKDKTKRSKLQDLLANAKDLFE